MRFIRIFLVIIALSTGIFLFFNHKRNLEVSVPDNNGDFSLLVPEAVGSGKTQLNQPVADIENQKPLANPPKEIKAVYATSWSGGSNSKINYFINLIKTGGLNAIIIDIKDFSGYVAYDIKNADVEKYKAKEIRIPKVNALLKKLHDEGIYVIARQTVFQDPVLAKARPDLAVANKTTGGTWADKKGLSWMDPASKEVWDYNIAIAKDAAARGFDEVNFDYIRFPSDGALNNMKFPFWDGKTAMRIVIRDFFRYLRKNLAEVKISADLFGLSTINNDDLGIGQKIEDAYENFDYISPMVYPSHYAKGFNGYQNPAKYPYEVVNYSISKAIEKYKNYTTSTVPTSKLRPWLQDFDLGADYTAEMIKKEINAVYDAASSTPQFLNGFALWSPSNVYTRGALQ